MENISLPGRYEIPSGGEVASFFRSFAILRITCGAKFSVDMEG